MSNDTQSLNDPLSFVRNLWSGMGLSMPGMVTPTFDVDELDKRITDMKAVEGWLRMNLSMLQMTIQGLEMQKTTLTAVRAMGTMATNAAQQMADSVKPAAEPEPAAGVAGDAGAALSQAAMWPWQMMQQMQEHLQQQAEAVQNTTAADTKSPGKRSKKA